MFCRCNPDDELRDAERAYALSSTLDNLDRLNILRRRSGLLMLASPPLPGRIFEYGEGWQAQTSLPSGHTISSATTSHHGWWGIDHVFWGGDEDTLPAGNHFVREYVAGRPRNATPEEIVATKPTEEEVLVAHQQVVDAARRDGISTIKGYYTWYPGKKRR